METRKELLYSKTHEWVKVDGNHATIGLTDHAQDAIGEIVFIELPEVGARLNAGDPIGAVDSVKAVSEIYTPVSGEVLKNNQELSKQPKLINQVPYESWIAELGMPDSKDLAALMDETAYLDFCQKEQG